jgi:hypothetical protein
MKQTKNNNKELQCIGGKQAVTKAAELMVLGVPAQNSHH